MTDIHIVYNNFCVLIGNFWCTVIDLDSHPYHLIDDIKEDADYSVLNKTSPSYIYPLSCCKLTFSTIIRFPKNKLRNLYNVYTIVL